LADAVIVATPHYFHPVVSIYGVCPIYET